MNTRDYFFAAKNNEREFVHYDREVVLKWYAEHNGTQIYTKSKDLFPEIVVLVDKPNFDIRLFRKEIDEVNKTSISQRKANDKYDINNTKQVKMKLNLNTDKDILDQLANVDNVQGYLKELIRKDIESKKNCN